MPEELLGPENEEIFSEMFVKDIAIPLYMVYDGEVLREASQDRKIP